MLLRIFIIITILPITGCFQPAIQPVTIATPVLQSADEGLVLSASLADSLPEKFSHALHKGLLCQAIFDIGVPQTEAEPITIDSYQQGVLYDIWNHNYQLLTYSDSVVVTQYLFNPRSLPRHFPRLKAATLPADVADQNLMVRLTLIVKQVEDSEQIEQWSREMDLPPTSPDEGLRFGLGQLTRFYLGDEPLLIYQSDWVTAKMVDKGGSS